MPVIGLVTTIDKPVQHVFNYLSEAANFAEFWPNLSGVDSIDSSSDEEHEYRWEYKFMGKVYKGTADVTGIVQNKLLVIETQGDIYSNLTWSFGRFENGTKVTFVLNYEVLDLNLDKHSIEVFAKRIEHQIDRLMSYLQKRMNSNKEPKNQR